MLDIQSNIIDPQAKMPRKVLRQMDMLSDNFFQVREEITEQAFDCNHWPMTVKLDVANRIREIEEEKAAYRKKAQTDTLFADQQPRARRFFKDDGTPIQMNTAKWPFSIEEDDLNVYVDVALPRFLDSNAVRALLLLLLLNFAALAWLAGSLVLAAWQAGWLAGCTRTHTRRGW